MTKGMSRSGKVDVQYVCAGIKLSRRSDCTAEDTVRSFLVRGIVTKRSWGSASVLYGKKEVVQVQCRCGRAERRGGTGGKRAGPWSGHTRRNLTCQGQ